MARDYEKRAGLLPHERVALSSKEKNLADAAKMLRRKGVEISWRDKDNKRLVLGSTRDMAVVKEWSDAYPEGHPFADAPKRKKASTPESKAALPESSSSPSPKKKTRSAKKTSKRTAAKQSTPTSARGVGQDVVEEIMGQTLPQEDEEQQLLEESDEKTRKDLVRTQRQAERDELPEITITGREEAEIIAETWDAIIEQNSPPELFRRPRGERPLVRVDDDALQKVSVGYFHSCLTKAAQWKKVRATKQEGEKEPTFEHVSAMFPRRILDPMITDPPRGIPVLRRLVQLPAFAGPNFALATGPGFARSSGLYFTGQPVLFDLPTRPKKKDLKAARATLDEWLQEFCFADDEARATAIALLLTLLCRHGIRGNIPPFLIEAAEPGTGKSYLVETLALAAHGKKPTPTTLPYDSSEIDKRVLSWVLSQKPLIYLDNAKKITGEKSNILSALVTGREYEGRRMRENEILGGEWIGVLVLTGNNVHMDVEFIRRAVRVRLESDLEEPWTRKYRRPDLESWTLENRAEIVRAASMAIQAWRMDDMPKGKKRRPSFVHWSEVVGGIMPYLGDDLAKSFLEEKGLAKAMAFGRGAVDVQEFIDLWAQQSPDWRTALDLMKLATQNGVLETVLDGKSSSDHARSIRMANYLQEIHGKIVNGQRILGKRDKHSKRMIWSLQAVKQPEAEEATEPAETEEIPF